MSPQKMYLSEWISREGLEKISSTLGVARSTVCHWRTGRSQPTLNKIRLIKEITAGRVGYAEVIDDPVFRGLHV